MTVPVRLAPARYESATVSRAQTISRTAPRERRDALMGIGWGLSQHCKAVRQRDRELRGRGMRPIEARVTLAHHACRLCHHMLQTQEPFDEKRYARAAAQARTVTAFLLCPARAQPSCRSPAPATLTAKRRTCRTTAPDQSAGRLSPAHTRRLAICARPSRSVTRCHRQTLDTTGRTSASWPTGSSAPGGGAGATPGAHLNDPRRASPRGRPSAPDACTSLMSVTCTPTDTSTPRHATRRARRRVLSPPRKQNSENRLDARVCQDYP
jgi:hypothetical protein